MTSVRPRSPAHGGLDQFGPRPVVELAVRDAGGTGGDSPAIADFVVHFGESVGEEEVGDELGFVRVVSVHTLPPW